MSLNNSSGGSSDQASSDLIGTGVRIGLYLQGWSFLINCFFSSIGEIPSQILPTAVIVFSFLISTITLITSNGIGHNEVLVTLDLVETAIFPALFVMNIAETRSNGITIVFMVVDALMTEVMFIWLTAHGGKVDRLAYTWGWIFFVWTLGLFPKPILCWWRLIVRYFQGKKELDTPDANLWDIFRRRVRNEDIEPTIPLLSTRRIFPVLAVVYMILQTWAVERNIKQRGLQPNNQFNQPGQLIPLVTGALSWLDSIARILRVAIRRWRGYPENTSEDALPVSAVSPGGLSGLFGGKKDKGKGREEQPPVIQEPQPPRPHEEVQERWSDQFPSAWRA